MFLKMNSQSLNSIAHRVCSCYSWNILEKLWNSRLSLFDNFIIIIIIWVLLFSTSWSSIVATFVCRHRMLLLFYHRWRLHLYEVVILNSSTSDVLRLRLLIVLMTFLHRHILLASLRTAWFANWSELRSSNTRIRLILSSRNVLNVWIRFEVLNSWDSLLWVRNVKVRWSLL